MRRVVATLLATWFALASVDQSWLHACPMHDGLPTGTQGVAGTMSMHHGHGQPQPVLPDQDASHACTCLGDCAAATSLPLIRPRLELAVAAVIASVAEPATAPLALPVGRPRFVLPYATAPPAPVLS